MARRKEQAHRVVGERHQAEFLLEEFRIFVHGFR